MLCSGYEERSAALTGHIRTFKLFFTGRKRFEGRQPRHRIAWSHESLWYERLENKVEQSMENS